MLKSWGADYAGRIRWRLGTEANGPRWTNHGEYESQYIECYKLTMERIKQVSLSPAPGVSNEGGSSELLVPLPAVSWLWVPAWGSLEPSRQGGENAQKTGKTGGKWARYGLRSVKEGS